MIESCSSKGTKEFLKPTEVTPSAGRDKGAFNARVKVVLIIDIQVTVWSKCEGGSLNQATAVTTTVITLRT